VAVSESVFSREYDLPVSIVWDAMVDDVLVEGWLAVAVIEPCRGGEYWLNWQSGTRLAPTNGIITTFEPPAEGKPARLAIKTDNLGTLDFTLVPLDGGTRGSSTRLELVLRAEIDRQFLAGIRADWQSNFDQLEELLRGHPVDWSTWERDRGEAWTRYLAAASRGE
jgi:uncharacterized protein YndB with AHSA1/START domain